MMSQTSSAGSAIDGTVIDGGMDSGARSAVITRAFRLLDSLVDCGTPATLADLASLAGLPRPTALRLLRQLVAEGAVERSGRYYRPGMRLFEFGTAVARQRRLREAAVPFMQELCTQSHATVHLGAVNGLDVLYLEKLSGAGGAVGSDTYLGARKPLYCTGIGKAILAFSPPELVTAVARRGLPARTPRTIVSLGLLQAELERIRARGVAYDIEESRPGVVCVAAPVLDVRGHAQVAMSLTGPSGRLRIERLAPVLAAAARDLSRGLGGVPWHV